MKKLIYFTKFSATFYVFAFISFHFLLLNDYFTDPTFNYHSRSVQLLVWGGPVFFVIVLWVLYFKNTTYRKSDPNRFSEIHTRGLRINDFNVSKFIEKSADLGYTKISSEVNNNHFFLTLLRTKIKDPGVFKDKSPLLPISLVVNGERSQDGGWNLTLKCKDARRGNIGNFKNNLHDSLEEILKVINSN